MAEIKRIVVHCSDSPQGRGDTASTVHRWHVENGWSGIGYHAVILENGTIEQGRPEYWKGAHVGRFNAGSLGVCLIGIDSFTAEQYDALYEYLADACERHPRAVVYGHRDLDSRKNCPGFDVAKWLETRVENSEIVING